LATLTTTAFIILSGCTNVTSDAINDQFLIDNQDGLAEEHVTRVISELDAGYTALKKLGIPLRTEKFPITVRLKTGQGISRSFHGRGPIVLYRVAIKRSAIIHEVTHMLAGYTRANGHWTTEGFASYMQDNYGGDIAYPTRRRPYELMRVILDEGVALPMENIMRERRRQNHFSMKNKWNRFLAYAQSSSFCTYLIDTYGIKKFFAIYDQPYEDQDFKTVFGRSGPDLVTAWQTHIRTQNFDLRRARRMYRNIRKFTQ
jgi:hypothetical protein